MRYFVITGHRAVSTGDFKLDDIAGGAGRLDILVRCVNSAFFLSHNLRKDVEAYLVLMGGDDPPKTVIFKGADLRYADGVVMENVDIRQSEGKGISLANCRNVSISSCRESSGPVTEDNVFIYKGEAIEIE